MAHARYFPAGHCAFHWTLMAHPQMLTLQRRLLRCTEEDIRVDHVQALNRQRGFPGGSYHTHATGVPWEDNAGLTERMGDDRMVILLCYPGGFGAAGDGGVRKAQRPSRLKINAMRVHTER